MRSVPAGSFERMTAVGTLWRAYQCYRRGKSRRQRVATFDLDADRHLFALRRDLRSGKYRPGSYSLSVIRDPKIRLISAQPIRDCVVQQALLDVIGPTYERAFIEHAYACLSERGPQRAVLQYLAWARRYRYRLSLDIRRYFLSIHRPTLLELIHRRLRATDRQTRQLVSILMESGSQVYRQPLARQVLKLDADPLPPEAGIPIGSYLSQWAGSLYLDGLDHFVQRELRIPSYLRYMDDFTLFAEDPHQLTTARSSIAQWLGVERRLELNPKRHAVVPTAQPSVFLGYRVSRAGIVPSRKMKKRMKKRVKALRGDPPKLARSLRSYKSLFTFG